MLEKKHFSQIGCRELGINAPEPDMTEWTEMLERIKNRRHTVTIGLFGKYVRLHDAYLSVAEALRHAGYECSSRVEIEWIDSETVTEENAAERLGSCDGILIPGGFGNRGIEGKIAAAHYARTNNVPYLGICLGMQIAVIEYARYVCEMCIRDSGKGDRTRRRRRIHRNGSATCARLPPLPHLSDGQMQLGNRHAASRPCLLYTSTRYLLRSIRRRSG